MNATVKQTAEIVISLTPAEAMWLKGYVQNQMLNNESDDDRQMRSNVFENLPTFADLAKLQYTPSETHERCLYSHTGRREY